MKRVVVQFGLIALGIIFGLSLSRVFSEYLGESFSTAEDILLISVPLLSTWVFLRVIPEGKTKSFLSKIGLFLFCVLTLCIAFIFLREITSCNKNPFQSGCF